MHSIPRFDRLSRALFRNRLTFDINYSLKRPIIFMERCRALEILHSHVKDKSKLHARTAVVGYEENAQGVILTTEDGDHHHGHILIGADGIHSKVRKLMADKIEPTNKTLAKEINEGLSSLFSNPKAAQLTYLEISFYK